MENNFTNQITFDKYFDKLQNIARKIQTHQVANQKENLGLQASREKWREIKINYTK